VRFVRCDWRERQGESEVNLGLSVRRMRFRDAASTGVFGLQSARDTYRDACTKMEIVSPFTRVVLPRVH
jgi:hypothetical protein